MKISAIRTAAKEGPDTAWRMLGWLLLAQVAVAFVGRSPAPLGPIVESDMNLTKTQVGMLTAAVFLGQSSASLLSGYFVDRIGSRRILGLLVLCLSLGFTLAAFVDSFVWLFALMTLGGLGYGAMHPTSNRAIIYWFPQNRRGTAMGFKQMGVTAGSSLAVLTLLPLALKAGWRATLMVASLLLLLVGLLSAWRYRDPFPVQHRDAKGFRAFLTSLSSVVHSPRLWIVSVAAIGLTGAQMSLTTYVVFFAHEQLGYNLYLAGTLLLVSEISGSLGRVLWGVISDRLFKGGRLIVLVVISLITALLSVVMTRLSSGVPYWVTLSIIALCGFGIVGFNGMWMNAAAESMPKESSGLASGFSLSVGSWGVVFMPPVFGRIVDQTQSYSPAWLFLAFVMACVMLMLIWALKNEGEMRSRQNLCGVEGGRMGG